MSDCPDIDQLLKIEATGGEAAAHVAGCTACSALVALATFRGIAARVSEAPEVCAAFEPSIAALVDGTLGAERLSELVDHLGRCGACNDLAARLTLFRGELDDVPEPEVATWGKDKVMEAIGIDATNLISASVEAVPVSETTELRRQPVVVLDGPGRWRQRARWTAAVAAGVAIGLIGGGALFLRDRGPIASASSTTEQAPNGGRASPGGALDLEARIAELEARTRAAEERVRDAEFRARAAEARVRELEARTAPSAQASAPVALAPPPPVDPLAPVPSDWTKPEVGHLTIVCNPYCDDVVDNGRSLGPSPIVHQELAPGRHLIVMRKDSQTKTLSVEVRPGDKIVQRINMR